MNLIMPFALFISSVELGLIYGVLALGVFLSFRTLNTPDLTVDGSMVTGAAVSVVLCDQGMHPGIGLIAGALAGAIVGSITGFLSTKMKIEALLAGILVMLGIYSINSKILGGKANVSLLGEDTIYSIGKNQLNIQYPSLLLNLVIVIILVLFLFLFLKTRLGFALRATGDNEDMVKSCGISSDAMRLMGITISNGIVGLSGAMLGQYQAYADVGMGVGMVVIGLASVIIGEIIFGKRTLIQKLIAVVLGAVVYRFIIAFAYNNGMDPTYLKLMSATIVAMALIFGNMGKSLSFRKKGGYGIAGNIKPK